MSLHDFQDWLLKPWPWYVSGPMIGLTVPLLLVSVGKPLGISGNLQHLCSIALPNTKISYFKDNPWRAEKWSLVFALGLVLGGFVAARLLSSEVVAFLPEHYHSVTGSLILLSGGFLVGFGTRYANGCTSGHSIMGLSNLKLTSLYATCSFFGGGLLSAGLAWLIQKYLVA